MHCKSDSVAFFKTILTETILLFIGEAQLISASQAFDSLESESKFNTRMPITMQMMLRIHMKTVGRKLRCFKNALRFLHLNTRLNEND
ncbi:hypothetical protein D2E23_1586 [Bifidobacterium callimiconis]|uniref:Uncharacterized protein n=1 Tax=Bifidobacterium callimiconis TaxID=2306973 RepID=A0A430FCJ7_9BIFI|nr:hypothetical protein D2E23_1586 [Bifidobacterium callimiconis]